MKTTVFLLVCIILLPLSVTVSQSSRQPADTTRARLLDEQARSLQKTAQYDSALVLYGQAADIYRNTDRIGLYVHSVNGKAECLQAKGSYDKSLNELQIGSDLEQKVLADDPLVAAQRLVILGRTYRRVGKQDSSIAAARQALEISRTKSLNNVDVSWDITTVLGEAYFDLGEHDNALAAYNAALNLYPDPKGEQLVNVSNSYNSMAIVYEARADYQRALEYFKRSLETLRQQLGDRHPDIGSLYGNIAAVCMRMGDYDLALEYDLKSLSIMDETLAADNPTFGFSYNNISMVYRTKGEFEKALDYGQRSRDIFIKKLGPKHPNVGAVINNIGRTYSDMGQYQKALESYQQAYAIWQERLGDKHPNVTQSDFNIGEVYGKLGNFDEARTWLEKSLNIRLATMGDKSTKVGQSYSGLAALYAGSGHPDSALQYYQKAILTLAEGFKDASIYANPDTLKSSSNLDLLSALSGKAKAMSQLPGEKNVQASLNTYQRAAGLVETIRRGYGAEGSKIQLEKLSFDVYAGGIESARKLFDLTKNTDYLADAFRMAEHSKAGILWDAITDAKAKHFAGIPDSLLQQESDFREGLAFDETQLQKEKDKGSRADQGKVTKWENAVFDTRRKYDALLVDFEKNHPRYHELVHEQGGATLKDIQTRLLDGSSALLEYVAGDSSVTILAVTNRGCLIKVEQLHAPLAALVQNLRRSLQNLEVADYLERARTLYIHLLAPVARELRGKKRVYIVPDGILNELPFEALLTKDVPFSKNADFAGLPYVIRQFDVSYDLSAGLFLEHGSGANAGDNGGFIGFAPVFSDKPAHASILLAASAQPAAEQRVLRSRAIDGERFAELKESEQEVKGILRLFKSKRRPGKVLLHGAAQESELKSADIGEYRFVHIATHGVINEARPGLSGIILAAPDSGSSEDGILYSGEIYNLKLNADLVVLSACESGLGTIAKGEGILGLTRGFLYAGAKNVVVSLWQVADQSTAALMIEFYKGLLKGQPYAGALRSAKLAMIKGGKYAHPLEWSPFVLAGR